MVTAAGGNAAKQALRVALEYQVRAARGRPVKSSRRVSRGGWESGIGGGARLTWLSLCQLLTVSTLTYSHGNTWLVCLYVTKTDRVREGQGERVCVVWNAQVEHLFCLDTLDGESERSHTGPGALGVRTWQTPDQGSAVIKQVTVFLTLIAG